MEPFLDENFDTLLNNISTVPAAWTNNNSESINHVLKLAVNWRPQALPTLIETTLNDLIKAQYIEAERAIICRGDYR